MCVCMCIRACVYFALSLCVCLHTYVDAWILPYMVVLALFVFCLCVQQMYTYTHVIESKSERFHFLTSSIQEMVIIIWVWLLPVPFLRGSPTDEVPYTCVVQ